MENSSRYPGGRCFLPCTLLHKGYDPKLWCFRRFEHEAGYYVYFDANPQHRREGTRVWTTLEFRPQKPVHRVAARPCQQGGIGGWANHWRTKSLASPPWGSPGDQSESLMYRSAENPNPICVSDFIINRLVHTHQHPNRDKSYSTMAYLCTLSTHLFTRDPCINSTGKSHIILLSKWLQGPNWLQPYLLQLACRVSHLVSRPETAALFLDDMQST